MNVVRLLAPVSIDFFVVSASASRDPDGYAELWSRVAAAIDSTPELSSAGLDVQLDHRAQVQHKSRYTRIDSDALSRSLNVVTFRPDPFADGMPIPPEQFETVDEVVLRLYPHGIALLEVSANLPKLPRAGIERWLDGLQESAVSYGEKIARHLYQSVVSPFIKILREIDDKHIFFEQAAIDSPEFGEALWVSRSLLVAPKNRAALGYWTKDAVGSEHAQLHNELLTGHRSSLVRWLNYAFVDQNDEGPRAFDSGEHSAELRGLRYAQLMYASLDFVDSRLKVVLANSAAARTRWELEQLRGDLVSLSKRAEVIIIDRQELQKYMSRPVRAHFEIILNAWDHDLLVERPVLFKLNLIQQRLGDLSAKRRARAAVVTDFILLGIGITSIVGTAVAITDFGRNNASSAAATGFDFGANSFTTWLAAQPVDTLLLASASASAILLVLYLYFRRDSQE